MRENIEKALILSVFSFVSFLPLMFRQALAKVLAFFAWCLHTDLRQTTQINLALCYPELDVSERKQLAKQSLYHTMMIALEIPTVWRQDAEKSLAQIVEVEGKHFLDEAQAQGKGVIVIAPHLGNWEYLGLFLGHYYDTVSLYQPPKKAWLEDLTRQGREKTGAKLMPTNKKGVLAVLKALKAGGVTGILPDQLPERGNGAAYVPFFQQITPTMTLIPSLLQRGNIVAVAGFAQRLANGQFKIVFQAAAEDIYAADEQIACTALNQSVEQLIAHAPAQYQWEYKRFRRGDEGIKRRIYKK